MKMDLCVSRVSAGLKALFSVNMGLILLAWFETDTLIVSWHEIFFEKGADQSVCRHGTHWGCQYWESKKDLSRWNIYATHLKYWSLNLKRWSCASAAWFGITSPWDWLFSPDFVFHLHFYEGLCMCSFHVDELCWVWRKPIFSDQRRCFGWWWWTSVLAGQGGNMFRLAGVGPAAGCCSFDPQSNFSLVTLKLSWTGAFGPQEQNGLIFWGLTEKIKKKKCK